MNNKRCYSSETPKQESFKVALKTERAWFFSKKKERGLQSSPVATPGQTDGTLEGCLLWKFLHLTEIKGKVFTKKPERKDTLAWFLKEE